MVIGVRPPFSTSCNGAYCTARLQLTARTFDAARDEVLAAGWVERHRKGGARRSEWACPRCGAPAGPSRPFNATTAHGVVQDVAPLQELATVVLRHHGADSPIPRGAIGTVIVVHRGGVAYDVEWCDADGRTVATRTLRRVDLLLVR